MNKLIALIASAYLVFVFVVIGIAGESDTEDVGVSEHAITVIDTVESGSLVWTNSLQKPSRLVSVSWKLPASTTNTTTINHIYAIVTKTIGEKITTNSFFTPAVISTNYYPIEAVTYVTNTLYSGSTTNAQSVILDAGVSGDLPENYYILGRDILTFTFSDTNDIPIKFSTKL